ncbi:hypothetical protein [Streptomyces lavendofoliae]|uniref:Uncharacterized protein n=1 Tax=Streptomyces lavendofoliae TaxID=67314 RepID=A0A918M7P6_9ACTN|nr:hypothetical protein [Streptomyces lavendofoliae]GGU62670.1 hypothetical protein GCM10010274_59350 [Streptomyces lavendofoliae]
MKASAAHVDPPPALTAAQHLADQGHHVHYVAHGEPRCLTGHCHHTKPGPLALLRLRDLL